MVAQTQPARLALFRRWAGLFLLALVGWLPASADLPRKFDPCVKVATETTSFTYDANGNQISQTDPLNHTTTFQYDALGRRTARTLPGNVTETVEYSAIADPVNSSIEVPKKTLTDFNGRQTIQIHDRMDRLVTNQLPAVPGFTGNTNTYQYTVAGQRAQVVQTGAVNRVTRYAYDGLGRLRAVSKLEGTLSYGYDSLGTVTNIGARYGYQWPASLPADGYAYESLTNSRTTPNPNGAEWTYAYDARGRLQQVNPDAQTADAAYAYDAVGNLAALTFRNGVSNTYTYNERNWLRLVDSRRGGTQVALFDYDGAAPGASGWTGRRLSAVGQRQRVAEVIGSTTRTVEYTYDALRRLTQESITASAGPTGAVCYAQVTTNSTTQGYDWVGNRQSRKVTGANLIIAGVTDYEGHTFDARDRLQTGALYDANGNTTNYTVASQATNYVYDAENRLIKQSSAAGDVTITYDADGNRVSKTVATATTYYLVETLNPSGYAQVIEERSALTGDPTATYVYGLALISRSTINPQLSTVFYGTDGLGSVRYLTDANGTVTDTYTYDAFGIQISSTGTNLNNYRYTGQQWDPDLGMYYLRARYYRPELGRFWTMDTNEGDGDDPLSLHKYLYCQANPVNGTDPSGHDGDFGSLLVSMGHYTYMVANYGLKAYQAYYKARATIDAIELAYKGIKVGFEMCEKGFDGLSEADVQMITNFGEDIAQRVLERALGVGNILKMGAVVTKNRKLGNQLRDQVAAVFKRIGFSVAIEQYKPTPYGKRFIDVELRRGNTALGFEVKLGGSRYKKDQKKKDAYLLSVGYRVIVIRGTHSDLKKDQDED